MFEVIGWLSTHCCSNTPTLYFKNTCNSKISAWFYSERVSFVVWRWEEVWGLLAILLSSVFSDKWWRTCWASLCVFACVLLQNMRLLTVVVPVKGEYFSSDCDAIFVYVLLCRAVRGQWYLWIWMPTTGTGKPCALYCPESLAHMWVPLSMQLLKSVYKWQPVLTPNASHTAAWSVLVTVVNLLASFLDVPFYCSRSLLRARKVQAR